MRINNNLMAINTHRQMGVTNIASAKSMEKLSSGFRINRAGDDAAGLAISEKMRGQIRGLGMASRNAQDTISLIQTAEGALAETHEILQRMRELAVQSANDTNTDADRRELQAEVKQLRSEIDRIANSTEFNTKKLLEGSAKGVSDEIAGSARVNNNSTVTIDSIKMNAMMESVANDKSWAFDGAFMLIKSNQTHDANGTAVYNASDFKLVGPDGVVYDFRTLGANTNIKASELEAGTIIADGGAIENIPTADKLDTVFKNANVTIGAALNEIDIGTIGEKSVLASGSSFTIAEGAEISFGGDTGADTMTYNSAGVLVLTTTSGKDIEIDVGKSIRLDDGTILRNNGGGNVSVECGSVTLGSDMIVGDNVINFKIASQSILDTAGTETARDNVNIVLASNYSVAAGVLGTNVTIGNGINLTSNNNTKDANGNGDIVILGEGSVLARGSTVEMLDTPTGQGKVTTIKVNVSGNEVNISYDIDNGILSVGGSVVAPGKSITLEDGTVLTHASTLDDPNGATGKFIVETGRLILAEDISADTLGATPATNNNVKNFTLTKDSTLASGTMVNSMRNGTQVGTNLMAGTVITNADRVYPGSVTFGEDGTNIQFGANSGNSLEVRYHEARVGESLTFIFSRYEPAANNLRDSIMAQIGANSGQTAFISMGDMRASALNVANVDISTKFGAATAIETINNALQRVSHQRGQLGAMQNRLEHTVKNLDTSAENLQAAESRIRDVDMAKEIMEHTKNSILMQSAQAMLAQANQAPQNVLRLLQ
jgi:flagellin